MQTRHFVLFISNLTIDLILGLLLLTSSVHAGSIQGDPPYNFDRDWQQWRKSAHGPQPWQDRNNRLLEQNQRSGSGYTRSTAPPPSYDPDWNPAYSGRGLGQPEYGTKTETNPNSDPYAKFYGRGY